jgi:hypothetical protein
MRCEPLSVKDLRNVTSILFNATFRKYARINRILSIDMEILAKLYSCMLECTHINYGRKGGLACAEQDAQKEYGYSRTSQREPEAQE